MHNSAWVALLKHVPAEQQSRFMLVTTSGTEISLQSFLLIEQECVAVKGRLAGSQEAGRVFFIPYANIDYFGFSQPVKDTEFSEMFSDMTLPAMAPPPAAAPTNGEVAVAVEPEVPAENPESADSSTGDSRPTIRSEVLERFRSRISIPSPVGPGGLNNPQRTQP
jgi:hypothetical protein